MSHGEVIFFIPGEERDTCDVVSGDLHGSQSARDPADTAVSGIGVLLREAREGTGQSLRGVAQVLRIRRIYLEAIEDGRFQDLPGPAYATGFIRTYADHLALDSDEIIRRFRDEAKDLGGKAELDFPVPVAESGIPGRAVLIVGLVVVAGVYGVWTLNDSRESSIADLIPPPPDHLVAQGVQVDKEKSPVAVPQAAAREAIASDAPPSGESAPMSADGSAEAAREETPDSTDPAVPAETESSVSMAPTEAPTEAPGPGLPAGDAAATSAEVRQTAALPETPLAETPLAETLPAETPPAASEPVAETIETPSASSRRVAPEPQVSPTEVSLTEVSPAEASPAEAPSVIAPPAVAGDEDAVQVAVIPPPPNMPAPEPRQVRTYGAENAESRILLRARVNSWIQVRDEVNNQLLVTRLLRVGDSFRVPNRPGLKLLTGNAGGLDILVDGEVVPPIGPLGAVRRDVLLDTVSLLQGAAARN